MGYAPLRSLHHRSTILGIPVDRCSLVEFRAFCVRALASSRTHRIVTLNPEMVVAAHWHPRFANILRTADLLPIDGVGIVLALRASAGIRSSRLGGMDILPLLCDEAVRAGVPIAFLLRTDGLTTPPLLRATLKERWPELAVAIGTVAHDAPLDEALVQAVNDHAPAFLLMNIGGVAQEEWITTYADRFPSVRIIGGFGGAIDYLCGTVRLPPDVMRRYGLVWAWRLLHQPWRWRRIANAVIVFPLLVLADAARRCIRVPRFQFRLRLS